MGPSRAPRLGACHRSFIPSYSRTVESSQTALRDTTRVSAFTPSLSHPSSPSCLPCSKPDLLVVSTGTEVPIAVEGAKKLAAASGKRVAVTSLMCIEVYEQQVRPSYRSLQ